MMNIVFFGSSKYVLPILQELQKEYTIALVLTTEKNAMDAVPKYCLEHGLKFLQVDSLDENTQYAIRNTNSPVGVLADFGLLISQEIIDMFPKGIVNIHPSLLPKLRGSTPGQTAILNGDKKTGVSIMLLDKELDHGPLLG